MGFKEFLIYCTILLLGFQQNCTCGTQKMGYSFNCEYTLILIEWLNLILLKFGSNGDIVIISHLQYSLLMEDCISLNAVQSYRPYRKQNPTIYTH